MDKALELSEAGMLPERQYMQVRILPGSPLCAPFHDPVAEWIRHWVLASSRSKDREQRVRLRGRLETIRAGSNPARVAALRAQFLFMTLWPNG